MNNVKDNIPPSAGYVNYSGLVFLWNNHAAFSDYSLTTRIIVYHDNLQGILDVGMKNSSWRQIVQSFKMCIRSCSCWEQELPRTLPSSFLRSSLAMWHDLSHSWVGSHKNISAFFSFSVKARTITGYSSQQLFSVRPAGYRCLCSLKELAIHPSVTVT